MLFRTGPGAGPLEVVDCWYWTVQSRTSWKLWTVGIGLSGPGPLGSCGLLVLDCPVPDLNYVGLRPPCVILGWAPEGAQPKITLNVGLRPPFAPAARFPAPRSLLLVQARRARPVRGEDSQASQGQASKPSQGWMGHLTLGSQPRWPPAFFSPEK